MEPAGLVGARPAEGRETLVGRRVGLPKLNSGISHWIAVAVDDGAGQPDHMARGTKPRQIRPFRVFDQVPEGSDRLAAGGARHPGLHRSEIDHAEWDLMPPYATPTQPANASRLHLFVHLARFRRREGTAGSMARLLPCEPGCGSRKLG